MKVFIISDTHFFHKNIIRYCNRPFYSVEQMNDEIINRWNRVVSDEDLVIHLGDFSCGSKKMIRDLRRKLKGRIILIQGNHDYKINEDLDFMIIRGSLQIGNMILTHKPLLKEEIPKGFINIHGHIHDKKSVNGVNVSVERIGYQPQLLL